MRSRVMLTGVAVLCAVVLTAAAGAQVVARNASVAAAQRGVAPSLYGITVFGGGFAYNPDSDNRMFAFGGVGLSRSLTRYAAVEVRGGYANTYAEFRSEPMVTGDVVLIARLPIWRLTPYAGVAGGLLYQPRGSHYLSDIQAAPGTSTGAVAGLSLALQPRVSVRSEFTYRHDRYFLRNSPVQNFFDANNFAVGFGLTLGL